MATLERNHVFEIAALEECREGAVKVLEEADRISREFDKEVENAKRLMDRVPLECRDVMLQGTLASVSGTIIQDRYQQTIQKVTDYMTRLTSEIPPRDTTAAELQETASQTCTRCSRMLAGLEEMLEGGILLEDYETFTAHLQTFKTEWEKYENEDTISTEEKLEDLGFGEGNTVGGDPVNMRNGNFLFKETLLFINGRFPLSFTYSYNSLASWKGSMGRCFRHSMEIKLEKEADKEYIRGVEGDRIPLLKKKGGYQGKDGLTYRFDEEGRCIRKEDPWKNGISLTYDTEGRVTKAATDSGEYLFYHYEGKTLKKVIDHTGRNVELCHKDGQLVRITDPEGQTICYEYAPNNRISRIIDRSGRLQASNTYDGEHRIIHQYFGDGTEAGYRYMEEERETETTGPDGKKRIHRYDKKGRQLSVRDAKGKETKDPFSYTIRSKTEKIREWLPMEYDSKGDIVRIHRGNGTDHIVTDNKGNIKELHMAEGICFTYTYDALNRMESRTDGRGYTTFFTYDNNNRLLQTRYPDGSSRAYAYDGNGKVIYIRREDGSEMRLAYDTAGRLTGMEDAKGGKAELTYDIYGRLREAVRIDGSRVRYYYEEDGKIRMEDDAKEEQTAGEVRIGTVLPVMGEEISCTHDAAGNVTGRRLKDGREYQYEYDSRNRLTAVTDVEGNTFRYAYDACGRCIAATDPLGATTQYLRNDHGRIYAMRDAEGRTTHLSEWDRKWGESREIIPISREKAVHVLPGIKEERDEVGRLTIRRYPGDISSHYEYDRSGRIAAIIHKDGQDILEQFKYRYDGNGSCIHMEKRRKDCPGVFIVFGYLKSG